MGIQVGGGGYGAVSQPLLYLNQRHMGRNQQICAAMAQIVKSNPAKIVFG